MSRYVIGNKSGIAAGTWEKDKNGREQWNKDSLGDP